MGGSVLPVGRDTTVEMSIVNRGARATTGGTVTPVLLTPDVGSVAGAGIAFGALGAHGGHSEILSFDVTTGEGLPAGTGFLIRLDVVTDEGYLQTMTASLTVGRMDAGAPVGPDKHGYWLSTAPTSNIPLWRRRTPGRNSIRLGRRRRGSRSSPSTTRW